MLARVHMFGLLLGCSASLLTVSPSLAASRTLADNPPATASEAAKPATTESAIAERERLRAELARMQAEIDHLKAGGPGLRRDYVLRARQADAEALARRLTELDAQIKARTDAAMGRPPAALAPAVGPEPVASPTDGPTELEAKADILTDQARRTQAQAVALQARIDQVRDRMELHRRASALENDPFAPLEGSRRRQAPAGGAPLASRGVVVTNGSGPPPPAGAGPVSPTPGGATSLTSTGAQDKGAGPTPTATAGGLPIHDVLDPSASAQVRRTDAAAPMPTDLPSMQRLLATLKARAEHLDAQAKALRTKARAH